MRKAKRAPGRSGPRAYGGWVQTSDPPTLAGQRKWTEYARAFQFPPVAIAALLRYALISGAKWSLAENESGSQEAKRGMEIVQDGLLDAHLGSGETWPEVVAKASMSYFNGSSIHATALGRRKDGMVVYTDIAHRPMHTITRWTPDEGPFDTAIQEIDGRAYDLYLPECLYLVERMLGDDPFGVGVLRLVVERLRRAGHYEIIEGSEIFSSLGGLPIARAPLEEIDRDTSTLNEGEAESERTRRTKSIEDAVGNRIKTPEKQLYLLLDSATYTTQDGNPTSVPKWGIEIVKGELQGLADIRRVITDLHLDVARMLHVEFVYVGGGDSAGTYGMHESKVSSFVTQVQMNLNRIARRSQSLARRLCRANGLDPDVACPTLVPEQIRIQSALDTVSMLEGMMRAGLHPKDPARNILREQRGLPPEPEVELGLPRFRFSDEEPGEDEDDPDPVDPDVEEETDDE